MRSLYHAVSKEWDLYAQSLLTEYDICLLCFRFNHIRTIDVPILELEAGIGHRDGRCFVAVAYQASELILWMSTRDLNNAIATYEARDLDLRSVRAS